MTRPYPGASGPDQAVRTEPNLDSDGLNPAPAGA
jgi:hypothetical protein